MPPAAAPAADGDLVAALRRAKLIDADETPRLTPLVGGVASDIWKVEAGDRVFCVKRALAKLRVAQDWYVPVERNANEAGWIDVANTVVPGAAPRLLAHVPAAGLFAMDYLKPDDFPVWKALLRDGHADPAFASEVGARLAAIHAATAGRADIAARFAADEIFHAIRLDAYLEAAARAKPDMAARLMALSRRTMTVKRALVHGDVSPKNILAGPEGPVFLDAECAWYGDPAFDPAFCLKHLMLKCLWRPASRAGFAACYAALGDCYLAGVIWESHDEIEARIAALLPGLLLGRIDGKSPIEYVTSEADKDRVRHVACLLLVDPVATLAQVWTAWDREFGA